MSKTTFRGVRFDQSLARRVASGFSLVFENAEPSPAQASSSGSRLRLSKALTRQWDTAFLHLSGASGVRNIVLVVDMSGSMCGMWETGGKEFVWGLILLAREGVINLRVFLTGNKLAEMPISIPFMTFLRLSPYHGKEGFRDTLQHRVIAPLLEQADCVLCWTDGQLTDGCVDAAEWRARGVHLIGATLAHPKSAAMVHAKDGTAKVMPIVDAMRTHFHSGFSNPDAVNLATQIATYIATTEPKELRSHS